MTTYLDDLAKAACSQSKTLHEAAEKLDASLTAYAAKGGAIGPSHRIVQATLRAILAEAALHGQ
jgi:hypothetical protein